MNARNRSIVVLVGAVLALLFISQGQHSPDCLQALPAAGTQPRGLFYELVPLCMLAITVLALAKLLRRFW